MNKKYLQMIAIIFSTVFLLTSCSESDEKMEVDSTPESSALSNAGEEKVSANIDIDELFKQAEDSRAEADKLGFEWSTTKPLIDKAHAAVKDGKSDMAMSFLHEAKLQSELAIKQAHYAKEHWQSYVPK
ncbi:MAG: hypothetical protein AB8D52_12075 [Gammaproteobacteria bacterium]